MTEEDSNDDCLFVTHKFEWRSNSKHWSPVILPCFMPYFFFLYSLELNSLIDHLDRKIQRTDSRFQCKARIPGEVSSTPPPANAPVWALSKNYRSWFFFPIHMI